jgi:hypothetical protein
MSKVMIRFSMVALCATAFVGSLGMTPSEAKTSRHAHAMKHRWHHGHHARNHWAVGDERRTSGFYSPGPVCPTMGRSFDCKIWPPPYSEDPDRKIIRR